MAIPQLVTDCDDKSNNGKTARIRAGTREFVPDSLSGVSMAAGSVTTSKATIEAGSHDGPGEGQSAGSEHGEWPCPALAPSAHLGLPCSIYRIRHRARPDCLRRAGPDHRASPDPPSGLQPRSSLLEGTANGELILAGGNGYRFAELAAASNPPGRADVFKVRTPVLPATRHNVVNTGKEILEYVYVVAPAKRQ